MRPDREAEAPEAGDLEGAPRPRAQSIFVGHAAAEAAFVAALRAGRLHHAWLIGGPRGIGKATLAYRVARWLAANPAAASVPDALAVSPEHPAARQVAALSHPNLVALRRVQAPGTKTLPTRIPVDAVRRALDLFGTTAGNAGYRVCVVDCAEDLNANSANALLKVLEEPPPRSLFLIVSHAPGRLLPTIRSRCRALTLRPLMEAQVAAVLRRFPPPFPTPSPEAAARAAALSEGSVAQAAAMLDPAFMAVVDEVDALLGRLRDPDWRRVLKLADALAPREADALFAIALDACQRHLAREIDRRQAEGPARLATLVEVCDKIARAARETATYNLDRRPLVLSLFGELAAAARTAP